MKNLKLSPMLQNWQEKLVAVIERILTPESSNLIPNYCLIKIKK